jgi:hypothetical protein
MRWGCRSGRFFAIQWIMDGSLSLGIHVDPLIRQWGEGPGTYGPYVDLHLGPFILSIGNRPARASALHMIDQAAILRPEGANATWH